MNNNNPFSNIVPEATFKKEVVRLKDGQKVKVTLLTLPNQPLEYLFNGEKNVKYPAYIVNRSDNNEVNIFEFTPTQVRKLELLVADGWEATIPMKWDMVITRNNANGKISYEINPVPATHTDLEEKLQQALKEFGNSPVEKSKEVQKKIDNAMAKKANTKTYDAMTPVEYPNDDIKTEDIPF